MSRSAYTGPRLPQTLVDQVQGSNATGRRKEISRKDRRKAERQQKKLPRSSQPLQRRNAQPRRNQVHEDVKESSESEEDEIPESTRPKESPAARQAVPANPLKSILKKRQASPVSESEGSGDESDAASDASSFVVSARAAKEGIAGNDAEIAALEKKLGIKGRKKSKAAEDDELDWLLGNGSQSESDSDVRSRKRKRQEDSKWLRDKRLRAASDRSAENEGEDEFSGFDDGLDGAGETDSETEDIENPFSADELDSDDFDDLDSELDENDANPQRKPAQKPQRENPYVAPVQAGDAPAKYIPPSLRKPASSDDEVAKQLRRQIQGQLNRLSEANILSILQAVEEIFTKNARQIVTSTIIDLLIALIANPASLNETFLILHAAFSVALYKVLGADFGAQLLERIVSAYEEPNSEGEGKQPLNLLAFLSCLYNFQLVGSTIVFDFIRSLLQQLSETNTERLLRVIRTSGQQLRQDDPTSLKDIVLLLQRSVAEVGQDALSVRTKFMIETINDLKNNRLKGGAAVSAVAAEHTTRLKRTLGVLNSRAKTTEPLRISLTDIKDTEKKGKWWLVGASYHDPAKMANGDSVKVSKAARDEDDGYESETPGHVNLQKLARQQGMNTDVRRAIFIGILSAADITDAHIRLLKLRLKSKQQLEIPRVLVHCVGAEQVYNPYYGLIARKFCGDHRLRKAFAFTLWDMFKQMDEATEDHDASEDDLDTAHIGMSMRKVVHLAKFYASLVTNQNLDIAILKKLDFAYLSANTSMFVEVLFTEVFLQAAKSSGEYRTIIEKIFTEAKRAPGMVQGLAYLTSTIISKAELAKRKKEVKAVQEGCAIAVAVLEQVAKEAPVVSSEDEEEIDEMEAEI